MVQGFFGLPQGVPAALLQLGPQGLLTLSGEPWSGAGAGCLWHVATSKRPCPCAWAGRPLRRALSLRTARAPERDVRLDQSTIPPFGWVTSVSGSTSRLTADSHRANSFSKGLFVIALKCNHITGQSFSRPLMNRNTKKNRQKFISNLKIKSPWTLRFNLSIILSYIVCFLPKL